MSNLRARRKDAMAGFTLLEIAVVLAVTLVIAGVGVPYMKRTLGEMRLNGAARSISNGIQVAKMRSAAKFTRARLYIDRSGRSFHLEVLDTSVVPNHWTIDGGTTYLPSDVSFSFAPVTQPPPNTQSLGITQSAPCLNDTGNVIGNTSCVLFNSRGIPVQSANPANPEDQNGIYLTNGDEVYGVTVLATGFIGTWRTPPTANPSWLVS